MSDPQTIAEWQEAADIAEFCLLLDSARQYGLVEGGPSADIERCVETLKRAAKKGIKPKSTEDLCRQFIG